MELKKLCESYLENYEYCEKIQYLSKYDERLLKQWLDGWVESIRIRQKMYDELKITEMFDEEDPIENAVKYAVKMLNNKKMNGE